jgi:hypothetical protein
MSRTVERAIDLVATGLLLLFAWLLRETQPALAGAVFMAAISFWLNKNAQAPDSPVHREAAAAALASAAQVTAAATAAAEVLRTAVLAAEAKAAAPAPSQEPLVPQ